MPSSSRRRGYAEWLIAKALGPTHGANSTAGYYAVGPDGTRYQIKARWLAKPKTGLQLSFIGNLDADPFDYLTDVLFGPDFHVAERRQIPVDVVPEHARYVAHANGHRLVDRGSVLADPGTSRLHAVENLPSGS
jgi:hypothetical protein